MILNLNIKIIINVALKSIIEEDFKGEIIIIKGMNNFSNQEIINTKMNIVMIKGIFSTKINGMKKEIIKISKEGFIINIITKEIISLKINSLMISITNKNVNQNNFKTITKVNGMIIRNKEISEVNSIKTIIQKIIIIMNKEVIKENTSKEDIEDNNIKGE